MTPLLLFILTGGIQVVGRFGTAQACPVGPERALTCAHVVDPRPFDPGVRLYPLVWSDANRAEGIAHPIATLAACDLAVVSGAFPRWYEMGDRPWVGARVRFEGYSWRDRRRAYEPREFEARVVRIVAGHIVMDRAGEPGSSGSCVLDEQGRVVAINCSGHVMESGEEVGRAVGIWGPWVRELLAARPQP